MPRAIWKLCEPCASPGIRHRPKMKLSLTQKRWLVYRFALTERNRNRREAGTRLVSPHRDGGAGRRGEYPMASRREFLQAGHCRIGAADFGARCAIACARPPPKARVPVTPLYKVVFDERFPASVAFGTEARNLGLPTHSIRGDITDLWFHELDAQWKKKAGGRGGTDGARRAFLPREACVGPRHARRLPRRSPVSAGRRDRARAYGP